MVAPLTSGVPLGVQANWVDGKLPLSLGRRCEGYSCAPSDEAKPSLRSGAIRTTAGAAAVAWSLMPGGLKAVVAILGRSYGKTISAHDAALQASTTLLM